MIWVKWNNGTNQRSERASHAARVRWDRYHAGINHPPRQSRIVQIQIMDSHRPMQTIRLQAEEGERGWGRWLVTANGERIGRRRFGTTAISSLIARFLA